MFWLSMFKCFDVWAEKKMRWNLALGVIECQIMEMIKFNLKSSLFILIATKSTRIIRFASQKQSANVLFMPI